MTHGEHIQQAGLLNQCELGHLLENFDEKLSSTHAAKVKRQAQNQSGT
jgi:hypothetical protein